MSDDISFTSTTPTIQFTIVFDFDGVLAIPWSDPEKPFTQIPSLVRLLHARGYKLSVASYNPRARTAVESWGLGEYFASIRSGADHDWEAEGGEYMEEFRTRDRMSKHGQIKNMHGDSKHVIFLDDSLENINEIKAKNDPHIHAVLINTEKGATIDDVYNAMGEVLRQNNQ